MCRASRIMTTCALAAIFLRGVGQADLTSDLRRLYDYGRYDDVIAQSTEALKRSTQPDKTLMYLRGISALRIGWFGVAQADLTALGDYSPSEDFPPASRIARQLADARRLCPPHVHEITYGKSVVFRVYYKMDDPWTRTIVASLPEAYEKVCTFYGASLTETAVFIFDAEPQYNAFVRALTNRPPSAWAWACSIGGVLLFCQHDADGSQPTQTGSPYFRSAIAHEFTHCLLNRYLGTTLFPIWLDEGLAMLSGALMSPSELAKNDLKIARIFATGSQLPMEVLQNKEYFYRPNLASTAYVQAFHMTRFLHSRIGDGNLIKLIKLMRRDGSLDAALMEGFGLNSQQFYDLWLQTATGNR